MNNKNYTYIVSNLLAKNGCRLKSEYVFRHWRGCGEIILDIKKAKYFDYPKRRGMGCSTDTICPAYSLLDDLCGRYAKEIFGEKKSKAESAMVFSILNDWDRSENCRCQDGLENGLCIACAYQAQKARKIAEDYLWENCLFNKIKKDFYISFGQIHVHSIGGKTFDKDCLALIKAKNRGEAHHIAMEAFEAKFHNVYTDLKDLHYFKRGVITLDQ